MKRRNFIAILTLMAIALLASLAMAETVKLQSPDKVEGACNESGGVYFPSSGTNSTYGCMHSDGHGIVCGGAGAYSKTCDTFAKIPLQLPNRARLRKFQAQEAAKAATTTATPK